MIDLYSSATPNGRKISIMLEELGVQYNAIHIDLQKKEQFSDFFSKISEKIIKNRGWLFPVDPRFKSKLNVS